MDIVIDMKLGLFTANRCFSEEMADESIISEIKPIKKVSEAAIIMTTMRQAELLVCLIGHS